jgi:hypothetical protein
MIKVLQSVELRLLLAVGLEHMLKNFFASVVQVNLGVAVIGERKIKVKK